MIKNVEASPYHKEITLPYSKSYINRALILASLSKKPIVVSNISTATDVTNMINCLKNVGLIIEQHGDGVIVQNSFPECEDTNLDHTTILETGDGGTTNRFLLALLARGKKKYCLKFSGTFRDRPFDEFAQLLRSCSVQVKLENSCITLNGPMATPHKIEVDARNSGQFVSAIMLSLADTNIETKAKNLISSAGYVEITQKMVLAFKQNTTKFEIPIDFSSLSYPVALALTNGSVTISNCTSIDLLQPDSVLTSIYKQHINLNSAGLSVTKANDYLQPLDVDCSNCPDLVPTLAYLASYSNGTSILKNLDVLKFKESDRLHEICQILNLFEVKYYLHNSPATLEIFGNSTCPSHKEYHSPNDHRMAMMAFLFMRKNSGGKILNAECVKKSFPNFYELLS